MARTSTTFAPGRSGNPAGKPRSLRSALRQALARTEPHPEPMTRLQRWCEDLIGRSISVRDRLAVMAYIDGTGPAPHDLEGDE